MYISLVSLLRALMIFYFAFSIQDLQAQQPATPHSTVPMHFRNLLSNPVSVDSFNAGQRLRLQRVGKSATGQSFQTGKDKNAGAPMISPGQRQYKSTTETGRRAGPASRPGAVCYTISGRDFLKQDSLLFYTGEPTLLSDGNVLISGEYGDYRKKPFQYGGFCMKTDTEGNLIWGKVFDSTGGQTYDYINYFRSLELRDGSIMLAGRTSNRISKNDDFVLAKLDKDGNQVWTKTYECRFWEGSNGSGDYFNFRELKEDRATGEVYFVGSLWGGLSTITKIDPADGHVTWSNGYDSWGSDHPFGIIIEGDELLLFQLEYGYYDGYVAVTRINKLNGDTLSVKHHAQLNTQDAPQMYNTYSVVKLDNGHYRMSGPTTRYFEFPSYTGTRDLYHAAVVELDQNFDVVNAFVFKNRVESNSYNTKVSLYPDGTGVFTMFDYNSPYTGNSHISIFRNNLIYHQRKRIHINEGMPFEPFTLKLSDGGLLNIKGMGDSTLMGGDGSKIDYYRMYSTDTASLCLGVKDSVTSIMPIQYEPIVRGLETIHKNVFSESRIKTFHSWNFTTTQQPSCVVISHCDTLSLETGNTKICPGNSINVVIHKNRECGSLVPLEYDSSFVDHITKLDDSTYRFHFNKPGSGYIYASLMGCVLHRDSVFVEVLPARTDMYLGADTVLCPNNQLVLDAGKGFASYQWQDGSQDTKFTVTRPGIYHVMQENGCGRIFRDTVEVKDHPPIPISIGSDRSKCNNDTLQLQATPGFINYKWSPAYQISSVTGQNVIINPLVDTIYSIVAEKKPGCFAYDTVRIRVNNSSQIALGADTSICRQDIIALDAGAGFASYTWSTGETNRSIRVESAGSYFVKATTADGCSSFDTLEVQNIYALPRPDLGPDSVICAGQPRSLQTTAVYNGYLWNNGAVTRSVVVDQTGNYWVDVIDEHGCKGSDTTFIPSVKKAPYAFLGADTAICSYGSLTLLPVTAFERQRWSTGSTSGSIQVNQPGDYWLEVTDDNHCQGRDTIRVIQKDCMEGLFVPSAFTPNHDGLNDRLTPMLFGDIRSFRFTIYNRWGEVVFETTTVGKGWDGTYGGRQQNADVFVWSCTYLLNGKTNERRSGKIVLVR